MDESPTWRMETLSRPMGFVSILQPCWGLVRHASQFCIRGTGDLAHVDIIAGSGLIMFAVRRTQVSVASRYSARPFSQSRPLNGFTDIDSMVSESMQRTLTLIPSGCERGM